jgi:uncharacterized protein YndB with AHSA1/START domain
MTGKETLMSEAWQPSEKAFMVATITFEDYDGGTKYTARVQHWSVADREAHEKMGLPRLGPMCRSAGRGRRELVRLRLDPECDNLEE